MFWGNQEEEKENGPLDLYGHNLPLCRNLQMNLELNKNSVIDGTGGKILVNTSTSEAFINKGTIQSLEIYDNVRNIALKYFTWLNCVITGT